MTRIHHARLVRRETIARHTVEFVFSHDEPDLRFRPGQFISVRVGMDADANPILRSYSIASPPERRGELVLILRLVPDGAGSEFFDELRVGGAIEFTGPMGFFVNDLEHGGDVVYAATGTGITPFFPMLDEVLRRPESGRVLLYWGLRSEEDMFFKAELADFERRSPRFSTQIWLSQPVNQAGPQPLSRNRGRIIGPILDELPRLRAPTFYLCGNGQMIEELKSNLLTRGVNRKRQIRTEAFFD